MTREHSTARVEDLTQLRALSHPLRMRILGRLRIDGPATATRLAAELGESSGATSYHLRQLAARGFVEDVPELGTGRERWWRAAHDATSFSIADFLDDPESLLAAKVLRREALRLYARLIETWLAEEDTWSGAWIEAAVLDDRVARLTPQRLKALERDVLELVDEYAVPPGSAEEGERVVILLQAFPFRELPL